MDRRIARTRRLLAEALVELVSEQRYDSITIRDITDKADIGYATFFRHYGGKDDLMLEIFTHLIAELEATPERHTDNFFTEEGTRFFQHVADNVALYRSILDSLPFARKLREHIVQLVQSHLDNHAKDIPHPAIPFEIAAQHLVSSLLGLTDWWLAQKKSYSVQEMAYIYERLLVQGTFQMLLPDNPVVLPWDKD